MTNRRKFDFVEMGEISSREYDGSLPRLCNFWVEIGWPKWRTFYPHNIGYIHSVPCVFRVVSRLIRTQRCTGIGERNPGRVRWRKRKGPSVWVLDENVRPRPPGWNPDQGYNRPLRILRRTDLVLNVTLRFLEDRVTGFKQWGYHSIKKVKDIWLETTLDLKRNKKGKHGRKV